MNNTYSPLSVDIVEEIKVFLDTKKRQDNIDAQFPNALLREDVLDLLDRYCTVIYFPLNDEDNNGFHVTGIPHYEGKEQHFVFMNTAQTIEKQAFTAAHELGHIWNVDNFVASKCGLHLTQELEEQIINRFAAELLIPEPQFMNAFFFETAKYKADDGTITVSNMLKVIVALMYHFFAPVKAVVYRCQELHLSPSITASLLLGQAEISEQLVDDYIKEIIRDNGYVQFQKPTYKKWISGLSELLEIAETSGIVSATKIEAMRNLFDLTQARDLRQIQGFIEITPQEGDDITNDN